MKILAVGDPHFKLEYPYADLIKDGRRDERAEVLRTIHEAAKDCDAVVLMGDNLDKRHNHSTVVKAFMDFVSGFGERQRDVIIITGNHETYEGDKTALDFMSGIDSKWSRWFTITPRNMMLAQGPFATLGFVPFMTPAAMEAETPQEASELLMQEIEKHTYDVLFVHHMVSDTFNTEGVNEIVLDRARMEAVARLVVAGHIHGQTEVGRTVLTGNIFSHEVGDLEKSILKVDTKDGTYTRIPLPVRPIVKVENPLSDELDELPENAIVKVVLTQKDLDVAAIKKDLERFDAHVLVENYPDERTRLHVDEGQTLDLSIPALLTLYAEAKKKDSERLKKAFAIVSET